MHGYVRKVTPAKGKGPGVYLTLSHTQSGRIQLRNLADKFVEDPVTEFPEGKLVAARVLSAEGQRVELTCKAEKREPTAARQKLDSFALGQVCCRVLIFVVVFETDSVSGQELLAAHSKHVVCSGACQSN